MTEVEQSRRERKKEETKDRIFKAAFALFKRQGVEATTIDEICEKADVAKGTFFNYFPHKEAVFGYLAEDWFAQAEAESATILARPGRVGPQLIAMFSELAGFYEEEPTLARYVLQEWMQNQHSDTDQMCRNWDDLALRLIRKLQSNGELRTDETPERLAGVIHCVHQGTILEFVASPEPPFPLKTELRKRLALAFEGLRPAEVSDMRYAILMGVLVCVAMPAAGQAPTDTLRLTLDDAVHRAVERGTDMRLARAAVLKANGQVREAFSPALPQITGSLTYTRQFASIYSGLGSSGGGLDTLFKNTPFGAPNTWNLQLQATQLLWSGGKVGAALSAAKSFRQVASLQQAETAADVAFQVKQAYWNAALQGRLFTIAADNLDQARQHLREVQLYQQAGTRAEYDLLRAQVDAANQEPAVVAARNGADIATLEIKRLLDLPADQPLVLATTLDSPDATIPVVVSDSLGGPDRPGLAAADATVRVQEQLVKVARADRWPSLSVSTTYNEQAFPSDIFPATDQFLRGWNGEVKLSFPIFLGFRTTGKIEQARADLLRAQAQRDQTYRQVDLQVAQARAEVDRARALLAARHQTVRQGVRAQHLASVRYTNGMATQLDVSDARVAALQAEVNEVQATRDYFVALAQLERALGRPVPVVQRPIEQVAAAPNMKEAQP